MTPDRQIYKTGALLLVLVLSVANHLYAANLTKISRVDEQDTLQLFFRFDEIPEYAVDQIGKRIDVVFRSTKLAENFPELQTDERLIKVVQKTKENDSIFSLYFRYEPQNAEIKPGAQSSILELTVLLGNVFSRDFPDISSQLHGITMLQRETVDSTNPLHLSQYVGHWLDFFKEYESPVVIKPQMHFTLPPFPMISLMEDTAVKEWLPEKTMLAADEKNWRQALASVRQQLTREPNPVKREKLLFTFAELQVRSGEYVDPHKLLQEIRHTYPDSTTSRAADYLFLYLQATHEDPYYAFAEIEMFNDKLAVGSPLLPYAVILQAETAITTKQFAKAEKLLDRNDFAYTGSSHEIRLLRQADIRYLTGQKIKALVSYLQLPQENNPVFTHPLSLANYSDTLYSHKRMAQAKKGYDALVGLVQDDSTRALSMFRHAMSRLHGQEPYNRVATSFFQIQDSFAGTEGAFRSALKTTDYRYRNKRLQPGAAIQTYKQLSIEANTKDLREEASFKEALVYALNGNNDKSLALVMDILRDFQNGRLKIDCRALLLERLPLVIKDLIEKEEYIQALVLARQNRSYFSRGWLDYQLLFELAEAYTELGVYNRAARTYQYILEAVDRQTQESVYLPLIEVLYESGQYRLVEDYADQYFFRYPEGQANEPIFILRLSALMADGKFDEAEALLQDILELRNDTINALALRIHFQQEQFGEVASLFDQDTIPPEKQTPDQIFIFAESLYSIDRLADALPLFEKLLADATYKDQALFRTGQIFKRDGKTEEALNSFQELAEKGTSPLWIKLAEEESQILQLEQKQL